MKKTLVVFLFFFNICGSENSLLSEKYKNLPILITGGCGFIGSHLAQKLVSLGAQVTILDNFSSGTEENISSFADAITLINGSITDLSTCIEAARNKKIIFHLAAEISVVESMQNPWHCLQTNIQGTLNLLEAARVNKVDRIIFSSSAATYGNKNGTCSETDTPEPISTYGFSKYIGEICFKMYNLFDVKSICLRYFNVYGERQSNKSPYSGVAAVFKHQLLNKLPITIFGNGLQTRDFVPVETIVRCNLALALLPDELMNGQVCNVATGTSINLFELLDKLKQQCRCNYDPEIIFKPSREADIFESSADCRKLQVLLKNILGVSL